MQAANAPKTLALTAFHQSGENRLIIHLVNSVQDEVLRPIIDVAEVGNVELKIAMKSPPISVKIWGQTQEPEWTMDADNLKVRVPVFRYHSIILVEYSILG